MFIAIVQTVFALVAGWGLFMLWRRITSPGGPAAVIVTAGFLLRALGGQLAFWISYLHLPIARSLQIGNGFWFFAFDGISYYNAATDMASHGVGAILAVDKLSASPFFVQTMALLLMLFGSSTAVALLLNEAAFLGCCAVVLSFPSSRSRATVVALAALACAPALVLWSLQPLKDIYFLFLVAAFFAAAQKLISAIRTRRRAAIVGWSAAMGAIVYGITGIRWYFGVLLVAAALPVALVAIAVSVRRASVWLWTAAVLAVLAAAFYLATPNAEHFIPTPRRVTEVLKGVRGSFDSAPGASTIGAGSVVRSIDSSLGAHETRYLAAPSVDMAHLEAQQHSGATRVADGATMAGTVSVPESAVARLVAGMAAMVLPHVVAERLGIVRVAGGRGLWLFAETDTIIFDAVLLLVFIELARAFRTRPAVSPVFWMILIVTFVMAGVIAYAVSNFGTLFRHRDMILLGLILLPLTVTTRADASVRRAA